MKKHLLAWLILTGIVLLAVSCAAESSPPLVATTATPSPTSLEEPGEDGPIRATVTLLDNSDQPEMATYINEHAGYAFDYPAGWFMTGEPAPKAYNYVIAVQSFEPELGSGAVSGDYIKLDFVTCNAAECRTLAGIQDRIDEQVATGVLEILSEESWTLPGGTPAIHRHVIGEMGLEVASLITEFDGRGLQVSGYGDLDAFDDIARTLRPAKSQPPESELSARLEIAPSLPEGTAVKLRFFLTNNTDSKLYVLNWFTPLEGIGGEIFRIKRDGKSVPYQGILASRGDPTPDAYTLLEAGETVSAEVDLSTAYDFSIPGTYTIEFIAPRISHIARSEADMATSLDDLGPVNIPANAVTVKISPKSALPSGYAAARETLIRYFNYLSEGKYADAAELHGAGYEELRNWNPTVDPDDLAGLLEQGCMVNGLLCLPVKTIIPLETSTPDRFEFAVQFESPDGSLFVLEPEGSWTENDLPRSLFSYSVTPATDRFVVQELPLYAP